MDPLASAEELASYLQNDLDRATADLLLAGASAMIRDECGWPISLQEGATLVADSTGSRLLLLPTLNLLTVAEVRVDGVALDTDQYTWSATGAVYRGAGWPAKFRSVEVDCDHGYDPSPDSVKLVALEVASRGYANPERVASRGVGGVSVSFNLDPVDLARLDPFRLR